MKTVYFGVMCKYHIITSQLMSEQKNKHLCDHLFVIQANLFILGNEIILPASKYLFFFFVFIVCHASEWSKSAIMLLKREIGKELDLSIICHLSVAEEA